jgi:GT2 family glycosyltransferase
VSGEVTGILPRRGASSSPDVRPGGGRRAPDVSVIVVSWNTRDLVERCLRSLADHADGLSLEACVVDNASSDGTAEMVREKFPEAVLSAQTENLGFGKGCNRGLSAISRESRYVLFLNPDAAVRPGAVRALAEYLDRNPDVGAVTCALVDDAGRFQEAQGRRFPSILTAANQYLFVSRLLPESLAPGIFWARRPAAETEVDWISGAVMMVRRAAMSAGPFFDETYFMYAEDMEASLALRRAGWKLAFLPAPEVVHSLKQSTRKGAARVKPMQVTSQLAYLRRHAAPWEFQAIRAVMLLGHGLRAGLYALQSIARPAAKEKARRQWDYVSYLFEGSAS